MAKQKKSNYSDDLVWLAKVVVFVVLAVIVGNFFILGQSGGSTSPVSKVWVPNDDGTLTPQKGVVESIQAAPLGESLLEVFENLIESEYDAPSYTYLGEGTASWYPFHPTMLSAASRDVPRGTWVRVTNTDNGKSVIVQVNDYGPKAYTKRVIDLNTPAFDEIADLSRGLIHVTYELVEYG